MAYILSSLECLQHIGHITSCYANISLSYTYTNPRCNFTPR
jgi:hypothetical protein